MLEFIKKNIIPRRNPDKDYDRSDFSDFFVHAPASEQKKVIKRAVNAANQQQRAISKEAELIRNKG
ncbi:MAG: hypothetical protein WD061_00065 [Candidatus Saccharimonadales bacterium]